MHDFSISFCGPGKFTDPADPADPVDPVDPVVSFGFISFVPSSRSVWLLGSVRCREDRAWPGRRP
ncbi:hypothetical protein AB0I10_19320 [Streptomyces sp. NPDC050636]|uniref:hypothetical protein n=1 Tax=Streptomyces sp. NPDC050636 TaxID=3154510 RepID=UPI00342283AC